MAPKEHNRRGREEEKRFYGLATLFETNG